MMKSLNYADALILLVEVNVTYISKNEIPISLNRNHSQNRQEGC